MNRLATMTLSVIMLCVAPSAASAQTGPTIKQLQDEIAALTAALKACQSAPAQSAASPRDEAITALRSVDSVISGGASIDQFRTQQLQAKIKVDALPSSASNAPLRAISKLYVDATTMFVAYQTKSMSADTVQYFKSTYASIAPNVADLPSDGIVPTVVPTGYTLPERLETLNKEEARDIAAVRAKQVANELIDEARRLLATIK